MTPVGKALWFIESHFEGPMSLDRVAEAAGLSRFHLSRLFASATGRSVAAYWRGRRLTEAARALAGGAPDILGVALDAGYGSHEAFTRAFREAFGVTPEALRAAARLDELELLEPIRMYEKQLPELDEPKIESRDAMRVAGLKEFHPYSDTAGIPSQWQKFSPHLHALPGSKGDDAYGICWPERADGEGFDYMAAAQIGANAEAPAGLSIETVPQATYAIFRHDGHVSAIQATCEAIFSNWLPASGHKVAVKGPSMIEHYGPNFDPRTGLGGVDIWIPIEH